MNKALLTFVMLVASLVGYGQFNVPYSGSDTSNACTGTLYDHGGPSSNYSNSSNGYFYITPSGGSLSMTFTSINMESCCDYVRIYDGIGTSGTLLLNASGSSLPFGGASFTAPSGQATVFFHSDGSVVGAGFAMNWVSAGGSTTPTVSFSVSTVNPPLNFPVSFTNSSTVGDYAWDFGDGSTSTDRDPSHTYTSPGTYNVQLSVSTCGGGTSSITQQVVVQNSPYYSVTPDSLYSSVSCGGLATASFTLSNDSTGSLGYTITNAQSPAPNPYLINESFESGLGDFTISPNAYVGFGVNNLTGSTPAGSKYIYMTGYTGQYDGLINNFGLSTPTYFSYYVSVPYTSSYLGRMYLVQDPTNPANTQMFNSYTRYQRIYVQSGYYYYSYTLDPTGWNHIELKNIDYTTKTFDLYLNGVLQNAGMVFPSSTVTGVSALLLSNTSTSGSIAFDDFKLRDDHPVQPLSMSQLTGILNGGASTSVTASLNTAGMVAGRYEYEISLHTNGAGADSLTVVPFVLDINGAPGMTLDKSCISFGSQYTGLMSSDSIRFINSGCDTLDMSSITATHADFSISASSLVIPPFDTAYLFVDFSPSAAGVYTDSIHILSNDRDTSICLSATGVAAPVVSTDSSLYHLTSIGCNDSVQFDFWILNQGQATMNWNLTAASTLSDNFDAGLTPSSLWQSLGSCQIGAHCYVRSGTNSLSMYGGVREATTVPFVSSGVDSVTFWARPGYSGGTCETPDYNENLFVQYSTNGVSWTTIGTVYYNAGLPARYAFYIPVTGNVQVRLYQSSYSGSGNDHYLVDDFAVTGGSGVFTYSPSSGSTTQGDSTNVNATLYVGDLNSGTYNYTMYIHSNDPGVPHLGVPVQVTILGEPNMVVDQSACLDFGTVINGDSRTDSVLVYNNGCDSLSFSSVTSTNTEFSGAMSISTIAPGDSSYLVINFNSTSIGTLNDTLFIQSNDTVGVVCLTAVGIGAPNFGVTPDSLYFSTTSCDDSLFANLTFSNTGGLSTLRYQADSIRGGSAGILRVTMLKTGADVSTEYPRTLSAITSNLTNAIITESIATTAAQLSADLANSDVLVIPEQEYISYTQAQTLAPAVQAFANSGGGVVILGNINTVLSAYGVLTFSSTGTLSSGTLNMVDPTHPVFNGVNPSNFRGYSLTTYLTNLSNPGLELLAYYYNSSYSVVAAMPYGRGNIGYYGYDFYNSNTDVQLGLANMVQYVASRTGTVDWGYLVNDSASVSINGTSTTGVNIITNGLSNGRYEGYIEVTTNDPSNFTVQIPVVLDVNGQAAMRLDAGCMDFDSLIVGLTTMDTTMVYNDGCDSLVIYGYASSTNNYSINNLPVVIAPGDSSSIEVVFGPSAMGNRDDTLWVYSMTDTLPLCVLGDGLGAPVVNPESDSLIVVLNKCDNFTLETFDIGNTGQGSLSYNILFGDYYSDTSTANYSTTGATTNHVFTGTPVVADSVVVTVIVSGDFDSYNEYYTLNVEGTNVANTYGTYSTFSQPDTVRYVITSSTQPSLSTWLSDGTLNVALTNSNYVSYYSGYDNYHKVKVEVFSSSLPAWLTFPSSATGTIPVGGSVTKSFLFTGTSIPAGYYETRMTILSNDPVNPAVVVPIIFDLREEALIRLSDTCLSFPLTRVGDTSLVGIWVVNDGCLPLTVSQITTANNVFRALPSSLTVPAQDSVQVMVRFVPTAIANYSSTLTVVSNAGTRTFCVQGSANATPVADFQFGIIDQCNGQVFFSDHSSQTPTSFSWDFGDGNFSQLQNPVHSYAKPGTYRVVLTVSNTYGWDTLTQFVSVNPLYVGFEVMMNGAIVTNDTLYQNTPVQFLDSSITASTWKWFLGDGTVSTIQNPTHSYANIGTFQISLEVHDTSGCTQTTAKTYWIVSDIGVSEQDFGSLQLYPNPSSGNFTIDWSETNFDDVQIDVLDTRGAVLYHTSEKSQSRVDLDLTDLPNAMYMLRLTNSDGRVVHERLIKQ